MTHKRSQIQFFFDQGLSPKEVAAKTGAALSWVYAQRETLTLASLQREVDNLHETMAHVQTQLAKLSGENPNPVERLHQRNSTSQTNSWKLQSLRKPT